MNDNKIDNAIESVNGERKEEMRTRLHRDLDLSQAEEPQAKRKRFLNVKTFALGFLGICAVCLAIVLPISLRSAPQEQPEDRYRSSAELTSSVLGCTIKEYGEQTGKSILYVDWYDVSDCVSKKYYLPEDEDDIVYLYENYFNDETGDVVKLSVVDLHTHVDTIEASVLYLDQQYEYNNVNIKWSGTSACSRAFFQYGEYRYYVELEYPTSEDAVLDIVKNMF